MPSSSPIANLAAERPDYDAIFRRLNPRSFPDVPYERQRELRDLWPAKQSEFREMIDKILYGQEPANGQ